MLGRVTVETRLCRRCWKPARADRMVQGYGASCARELGLTGATVDTGQDGPTLLDLLDETARGSF